MIYSYDELNSKINGTIYLKTIDYIYGETNKLEIDKINSSNNINLTLENYPTLNSRIFGFVYIPGLLFGNH